MILVVAEHRAGHLHRPSLETVAAAQTLAGPVTVVLVGAGLSDVAAQLAQADVTEIVCLEHDLLASYTPDGYVAALSAYVASVTPTHVLLPHTYQSRDFAPRLAARLGRPLVTDCTRLTSIDGLLRLTRPIFQGKVNADVTLDGPGPHLITLQVGAFRADAVRRSSTPPPVRVVPPAVTAGDIRQTPEAPFREARQAVDLTAADRIVTVGRGIREQQHVALAGRLASALGAELAASRPICDAGWLPMDRQVGSSGQTVAPKLYLALGVSGAIQHIVGMKGAKTIVAINKDPDAPIFEVASYGIVGDLFEVVPAMIAALEQP
jgi:electron transfer flavoprotein alpha subunit